MPVNDRVFEPLAKDHPAVLQTCVLCSYALLAGEVAALVASTPAELAANDDDGQGLTVTAQLAHEVCTTRGLGTLTPGIWLHPGGAADLVRVLPMGPADVAGASFIAVVVEADGRREMVRAGDVLLDFWPVPRADG